jgi:hypothetical protein
MVIVDGEKIPPGRRGFLLSKFVYEDQLKVKAARGLDKIRAAKKDRGATIAADPELSRLVSENIAAAPELLAELDDTRAAAVTRALADHLRSAETDLEKLLSAFLRTDDASFDERYRVFYSVLAPHLDLYRVHLGDTITLRSTTRDGYSVSTNLKVYGTYAFRGLELSPQAGALCLTDLVSFRALAGLGADDHRPELEALRAASGAKDLSREDVEANLFGAAALDAESGPAEPAARPELDLSALKGARARHESAGDALGPSTTGDGAVLSVAVLLRDDTQLSASARAIEAAGHRSGLELKAASWKEASGMLGRFTSFVRVVLFAAVAIAFAVALLVINNALVMATLERVRELGTLRAIGAQRSFVLTMLVLESGISGLLFGALGAGAAVAILAVLSKTGIPAHTEALTFLFSGPRLFPSVAGQGLAIALAGVLSVSIASGVYPGLIAMRVSPREAIQSEE